MYEINDWVILVGCVMDTWHIRKKHSFQVAKVIEVGQYDMIVKPHGLYSNTPRIVSKNSCRKIPVNDIDVTNQLHPPKIGDLVMYYHERYDGEVTKHVGHLLEIKYSPGMPIEGLMLTPDGEQWLKLDNILVLSVEQRNNS